MANQAKGRLGFAGDRCYDGRHMPAWLAIALVVALVLTLGRGLRLAAELFRIRVRDGQLKLLRGRLPPALLDEIGDVVKRERVQNALIRAVSEGGRARLVFEASRHESQAEQPLRNVLGRFALKQIRSGKARAK